MKYIKLPIEIGLLAILLSFVSACSEAETQQERILRPVLYQEVSLNQGGNSRTFNGTAQTDKVIILSFRNSGVITTFDMVVGQRVRRGQQLARLDNVQARLAYEQALASQQSAESQMKTVTLSLNRIRSLYEKGSASLSDYENIKNSYQNAVSSYESAQRSVDIQKEQINYGYINAPQSGVIASVMAELGETVSPGQAVAVLNAGDKITISLGMPETVINQVKGGMEVGVAFPAIGDKTFEGKVSEISPSVNAATSTYPVKIELLNATDAIRSGMAANVTFSFQGSNGDQLVIPARSVGEDSKGRFVFLVKESENGEGTVSKQHITVGELSTAGFVVESGLSEGQKIAVAGLQTLLDGQEVKLLQQ